MQRLLSLPPVALQRIAAVGMVLSQCAALGLIMHTRITALCLAVIGLSGLRPPQTRRWTIRSNWWYVGAITIFALKYAFAPNEFGPDIAFISTDAAYEIACCCLVLQILALFSQRYQDHLPLWFLGVGGLGLIVTGDIRVYSSGRSVMLGIVAIFFIFWGLFASTARRYVEASTSRARHIRMALMLLIFGLSGGLTVLSASLLHEHENHLERVLAQYIDLGAPRGMSINFSGRGGLSDVSQLKVTQSENVALRIRTTLRPNYLRGRVFDNFSDDRWIVSLPNVPVLPAAKGWREPVDLDPEYSLFVFRRDWPLPTRRMDIWPVEIDTFGYCFLPPNTAAMSSPSEVVFLDQTGIVQRPPDDSDSSYSAFVASTPFAYAEPPDPPYLQLPENLDPRVYELAWELCSDADSATEKIQAVQNFLLDNFLYDLGIYIPQEEDRLSYFLLNRPPAHCEYFATATAVLLRVVGVPARYVTGFVVTEQNPIDGVWTARRRDAHAWVEAWNQDFGAWELVESTPSEGVPSTPDSRPATGQLYDAYMQLMMQLREFVRTGGLWRRILRSLTTVLLLLAGVAFATAAWLSRKRWLSRRADTIKLDANLLPLVQERIKLDQFLAGQGWRRGAGETVLQFAQRLESETAPLGALAAGWYRQYSALRYAALPLLEADWKAAQSSRRQITRPARTRR